MADETRDGVSKPLTRDALYCQVWAEPMTTVAARYGVSSSFFARVCTRLNVPRPGRGHWAKLAVGKRTSVTPLPEAQPGDELEWSPSAGLLRATLRPLSKPPGQIVAARLKRKLPRAAHHFLLRNVREHFDSPRVLDNGLVKPRKHLLPDIITSREGLPIVLETANELYLMLEERGHRVTIAVESEQFRRAEIDEREKHTGRHSYPAIWSPGRPTVVYVGQVAIGLTVFEMTEEIEVRYIDGKYIPVRDLEASMPRRRIPPNSWTTKKNVPSGRLVLQAYSPYSGTKWVRQWIQWGKEPLTRQFLSALQELEGASTEIARLAEEARRQAEVRRKEWEEQSARLRQEQEQARRAEARLKSRQELLHIVEAWALARKIEEFFSDAENRASNLKGEEQSALVRRLSQARSLLGGLDALARFRDWKAPPDS